MSMNAAISASVVLASRLVDDISVFALMLFSIEAFALFPLLRRRLQVCTLVSPRFTPALALTQINLPDSADSLSDSHAGLVRARSGTDGRAVAHGCMPLCCGVRVRHADRPVPAGLGAAIQKVRLPAMSSLRSLMSLRAAK